MSLIVPIATAASYEQVQPPPKVVLPPPLSPADSLAAIRVPADLRVELVAAEPMVLDPIDVAWGADGRMWVVEMADYPAGMDGKGKPGGRIRVLESTKADGRYDKSTLFAEGLRFPTSVMPWRQGVLVTAAPDILYLEDTNGDGKADRIDKPYTGLGKGNQQHLANGLQWGLDGWLYLANGDSGGVIKSAKTGQGFDLGRRDLRIDPDEGLVEQTSGRSQFGRNRDDWGNWFGGNNANPVWHYALQEHYLRRNPHLAPPDSTITVPKIPGAAPVYPASRTMARFNEPRGTNHFTSACGVMIYRDDLLGPGYAGNVFVCEPVHNLVHRELIRPKGVTFTSERAPEEQQSEFLASTDNWSRFTATRTGPDGALYIADMYRLVIEHPEWIPDAWKKQIGDIRAGEDKGRIYRVYPRGTTLRPVPRLDRADVAGLIAALENSSGTVRDLAQQQLVWRNAKTAGPALSNLVSTAVRPATRLQALCTLALVDGLTPAILAQGLDDAHPGVRRHAVRLSESFARSAPELLSRIARLVDDPDASVRQQVAYTLGEWKAPAAGVALARLALQNDDPFILAAAMSSALPHAETMIAQMSADGGINRTLIEIAIATQNASALARLLATINAPQMPVFPSTQFATMALFLDSLERNNQSLPQLQAKADEQLKPSLAATRELFAAARTIAADARVVLERRLAAVTLLGRGLDGQEEDLQRLTSLLVPQTPVELQLAAIAALGRSTDKTIPTRLLAGWEAYGAKARGPVLNLLASRPAWAHALLDRIESTPAMLPQIDTGHRAALTNHGNRLVANRATRIVNAGIDANRQKVIDEYLAAMAPLKGNASRGRAVFDTSCTVCHKFGAIGGSAIGPDLAVLTDRSRPYLVAHILDPNRAIEDRSMLYAAATNDGRTLSGMLAGEAGNSITFTGLDGVQHVILRSELKSLASTGRSLMPDGLEAAITPQAMADLVAFIAGDGRAPHDSEPPPPSRR